MAVKVKVKYQIKIKGYALRNFGPIGISAQAKTESAVMEAISGTGAHAEQGVRRSDCRARPYPDTRLQKFQFLL